jgi:hypothetical protein
MARGQIAPDRAEIAGRFQMLRAAADQASQAYQQAIRVERQAWRESQQEPRIELELAQPIQVPPAPAHRRIGLLLAALAAGMAAVAGVGMITAGAAMEPTLATLDQAEAVLPVPIVGTIPDIGPASEPKAAQRWQPLMRLSLVVGGLILIAGCVGLLFRAYGA